MVMLGTTTRLYASTFYINAKDCQTQAIINDNPANENRKPHEPNDPKIQSYKEQETGNRKAKVHHSHGSRVERCRAVTPRLPLDRSMHG